MKEVLVIQRIRKWILKDRSFFKMNTLKTCQDLLDTITDIADVEANRLLIWATIYTRKCQAIKKRKLDNFKSYFDNQIAFYKRSYQKYAKEYEKLYYEYEKAIDRLIEQYNAYYNYVQNEEVFAKSNQKIAIANFLVSKDGLDRAAQKKLNYDIIIDECDSRLTECANDTYADLDELFSICDSGLNLKRKGYMKRLMNFFKLTFGGEKGFKNYVLEPLKTKIANIDKLSIIRTSNVKIKMIRFVSQMENIRTDVNLTFNETLNKN